MSFSDDRTVMAFDYGTKRIGVAVGQTVSRTASALKVLSAKDGKPPWEGVGELVSEWRPDVFVVGMPTRGDGRPHTLSEAAERFSRQLHGRYGRPVETVDEHLSSIEAAREDTGRGKAIDANAARLILMTWFENETLEKAVKSR